MTLRSAGFTGLVTYTANGILGRELPSIAKAAGFKGLIVGVWNPLDSAEIEAARTIASNSIVVAVCVGNEGLGKRYTFSQLSRQVQQLRDSTHKPVSTSEQIEKYSDEQLLQLGDWIFPNAHPYFHDRLDPDAAVRWTQGEYQQLVARTNRFVIFKEVGLPTAGDPEGKLSETSQEQYYVELEKASIHFVYFEAFDAPWKNELPVEPHWGLFKSDRAPKLLALRLTNAAAPAQAQAPRTFWIYRDADTSGNHFKPAGYMGDVGDIEINENFTENPHSGKTSIRVQYTAKGTGPHQCVYKPPCRWAGVYWQEPPDNWGENAALRNRGFDLSGYTRLVFWARADQKSQIRFQVGGIDKPYGDSLKFPKSIVATLTTEWQEFVIDLSGANLSHIIGGFAWTASADSNPKGATFYLDDIRFETSGSTQSQGDAQKPNICIDRVEEVDLKIRAGLGVSGIRQLIKNTLNSKDTRDEGYYFYIAELMKRVGDYQAAQFYEKAIQTDEIEACYESFYADYLRNFRGALTPLFPQAEGRYFAALRKLAKNNDRSRMQANQLTKAYVQRGLSALYERDGVAIAIRQAGSVVDSRISEIPVTFLSSIDRYAESAADLDRAADVRDYTSEALVAQSPQRLNRPLTQNELRAIVRTKRAADTLDRVRFRYESLPVIDVFYGHRQTSNAQITDFRSPTVFNDLRLNEYGVRVQKPFTLSNSIDVSLAGAVEMDQRWGLIESHAGARERLLTYSTNAAVSHFFGPDRANFEFTYAYQMIHPEVAQLPMPDRHRQFVGASATYQVFRRLSAYDKRFETRGWDFFAGFLNDTESFGNIDVRRHDYFVGSSLKGIGAFDFTIQPTWFSSRVEGDPTQSNSQYRTNFTTLIRLVDEERKGGIPQTQSHIHLAFVHLVIPVRHDMALSGPNSFENYKIGSELDSKFFTYSRWITVLASLRYDYQNFYHLNRNANCFTVNLSLGF